MARPLRIEYPGAVYHLTSRGDARQPIYLSDDDRRAFLGLLAQVIDRFQWRCHAYCLMDNHYHLLVETATANLSRGMRHLNGVYTQRFNRSHGRVGHLFQGRYKAILVEKQSHLLELCRYVVLNPVRAGAAAEAADWPWSSYRKTAGLGRGPAFLHTHWLLEQLAHEAGLARLRYRNFVAEGGTRRGSWHDLAGPDVLGSQAFAAEVQARAGPVGSEVPRKKRYLARPALAELRERHPNRAEWMALAYRQHGYTMRQIAEAAGLHYSSISKIVKAWEQGAGSGEGSGLEC